MTGSTTAWLARRLARLPLLLSKHLWVWPMLGAVLLSLTGYWVRTRVEEVTRAELASRLSALLSADVAALRLWFSEQESDAKSFASDVRIDGAIVQLAAMAKDSNTPPEVLAQSEAAHTLHLYLIPLLQSQHYLDYVVLGTDGRILASPHARQVGRVVPRGYQFLLQRGRGGRTAVSRPFAREGNLSQRAEGPTMFVSSPVRATNNAVVAVLCLRMKPEGEFSQIFSVARMGETGEAYAFDHRGVMLTASRFDRELKILGLIPKSPEATSILNLQLLDPEVDLETGDRPDRPRRFLSLTRMAAAAIRGDDGVDVQGYRNYRGVRVVGAWAWLPEFGIGVATEVSAEEGFQTLYMLRRAFTVLFGLVVLSGVAIFAFGLLVERLQASLRKSALDARRVGQYVLLQEIGRGANGMVYRARHALLRRPVAIKLLSPELTNEASAARFEREVQMTSQLTHPNTVAIYDYGRTPEGLFYYAMEYLHGIDLDQLVRKFGPQPEGRVIHILRQLCGSLAEAHRIGLIHRDIKPANILLTRRDDACDVVKVLDFGLVTTLQRDSPDRAPSHAVVGTPHFMSPEAIAEPARVDGRSDVYSVGAVGYWLLTGKTLFDSESVAELLEKQIKVVPQRASDRLGDPVSADLERLVMRCLAKEPEGRPAGARELDEALARCSAAQTWTMVQSERWWTEHANHLETVSAPKMAEKTLVIADRL